MNKIVNTRTTTITRSYEMDEAFPHAAIQAVNLLLQKTELKEEGCSVKCEMNGEWLAAIIDGQDFFMGITLDDPAEFGKALQECLHWLFSTTEPFSHGWRYVDVVVNIDVWMGTRMADLSITYTARQEKDF